MASILRRGRALGVAEVMDFPSVIAGDPDVLAKVALHPHVDGHAPGVTGRALDAYAAAGIRSDHEATTWEEALEKRRRGLWVLLREASNARNLLDLLELVRRFGPEHCAFCTDDREPDMLVREGHIDAMCRAGRRRRDRARGRAADGDAASRPLPPAGGPRRDRAGLPRRPRRARGPRVVPRGDGDRGRRGRGARRGGAAVRRARGARVGPRQHPARAAGRRRARPRPGGGARARDRAAGRSS